MIDHEQWIENNKEYLRKIAVPWVHLLLQRHIELITPVKVEAPSKKSWFNRSKPASSAKSEKSKLEDAIDKAEKFMADAETSNPHPALTILREQFGLTKFERNILLLCAAIELDSSIATLCAKANNNDYKPYPTFDLAEKLFKEHHWDERSAERPLRHWLLLGINQPGSEPLATSALSADERIVDYLCEPKHVLDARLLPYTLPFDLAYKDESKLAFSQLQIAESFLQTLEIHRSVSAKSGFVIQLTGSDIKAKTAITKYVFSQVNFEHPLKHLGMRVVQLPIETLPTQISELENLLRLWGRECLLLPKALYVDLHRAEDTTVQTKALLQRLLQTQNSIVIIATRDYRPEFGGFSLGINKPTSVEQQEAWKTALGSHSQQLATRLAGQFNMDLNSIYDLANRLHPEIAESNKEQNHLQHLWKACLLKTTPDLDQLAQRIEAKATWKDLVLPEEALTLLHRILSQVEQRGKVYNEWGFSDKMNRGLGLSALFAGESGTGKTMAAEVIAKELQLHLYRIDLSSVVSKYIGETEKNLRRLFDAAEDGGAVLFFDEADALFGKRSEVKDSHDRYANIEINYLLQRIEAYSGLAILATNMKSSLDQAFMRRLRFIVNFPFPGLAERRKMWENIFPDGVPKSKANLDYDRLARFNLTGGSIHNIALNAAFLAAAQKDKDKKDKNEVTMPLIFEAIRSELRKLDKPVNEAEFRMIGVVVGNASNQIHKSDLGDNHDNYTTAY